MAYKYRGNRPHTSKRSNRQPKRAPGQYKRGKPIKPCGTYAAYQRHMRNKEPLDEACREASIRYRQELKQSKDPNYFPGRRAPVAPCGTYAAAKRHQRKYEPLDKACFDARQAYWDQQYEKRREKRRQQRLQKGKP